MGLLKFFQQSDERTMPPNPPSTQNTSFPNTTKQYKVKHLLRPHPNIVEASTIATPKHGKWYRTKEALRKTIGVVSKRGPHTPPLPNAADCKHKFFDSICKKCSTRVGDLPLSEKIEFKRASLAGRSQGDQNEVVKSSQVSDDAPILPPIKRVSTLKAEDITVSRPTSSESLDDVIFSHSENGSSSPNTDDSSPSSNCSGHLLLERSRPLPRLAGTDNVARIFGFRGQVHAVQAAILEASDPNSFQYDFLNLGSLHNVRAAHNADDAVSNVGSSIFEPDTPCPSPTSWSLDEESTGSSLTLVLDPGVTVRNRRTPVIEPPDGNSPLNLRSLFQMDENATIGPIMETEVLPEFSFSWDQESVLDVVLPRTQGVPKTPITAVINSIIATNELIVENEVVQEFSFSEDQESHLDAVLPADRQQLPDTPITAGMNSIIAKNLFSTPIVGFATVPSFGELPTPLSTRFTCRVKGLNISQDQVSPKPPQKSTPYKRDMKTTTSLESIAVIDSPGYSFHYEQIPLDILEIVVVSAIKGDTECQELLQDIRTDWFTRSQAYSTPMSRLICKGYLVLDLYCLINFSNSTWAIIDEIRNHLFLENDFEHTRAEHIAFAAMIQDHVSNDRLLKSSANQILLLDSAGPTDPMSQVEKGVFQDKQLFGPDGFSSTHDGMAHDRVVDVDLYNHLCTGEDIEAAAANTPRTTLQAYIDELESYIADDTRYGAMGTPATVQILRGQKTPLTALKTPLTALKTPLTALKTPLTALKTPLTALKTPLTAFYAREGITATMTTPETPVTEMTNTPSSMNSEDLVTPLFGRYLKKSRSFFRGATRASESAVESSTIFDDLNRSKLRRTVSLLLGLSELTIVSLEQLRDEWKKEVDVDAASESTLINSSSVSPTIMETGNKLESVTRSSSQPHPIDTMLRLADEMDTMTSNMVDYHDNISEGNVGDEDRGTAPRSKEPESITYMIAIDIFLTALLMEFLYFLASITGLELHLSTKAQVFEDNGLDPGSS